MGLFDIFKRRSKKDDEKKTAESTEQIDSKQEAPVKDDQSTASSNQTTVGAEETAKATERPVDEPADQSADEQPVRQPEKQNDNQTTNQTDAQQPAPAVSESNPLAEQQASAETSEAPTEPEKSAESKAPAEATEDSNTEKYEKGLEKSRSSFGQKLNALLANFRHVDESFFDDLEDMLIESDVGFETSMRIADELRDEVKLQNAKKTKDVQNVIVKKLIDMYDQAGNGENSAINMAKSGPTVIMFVGVNGVGKTTTIGKMAKMYKDQGKKVVLAAADTFRAGAIEQLNVWAERDGVNIVKGKAKSDPASVVYDAVVKARKDDYDILMVDTAGRLQNKVNLMNELSKMKKILTREIPEAPHEVLLVLDATTGQNAMTQAKMFKETTDVSGIVLTKLDGTARGGIVLAIRSELHLPVKYVGLGEQVGDLKPFDPNDFVYGLFKGLISE